MLAGQQVSDLIGNWVYSLVGYRDIHGHHPSVAGHTVGNTDWHQPSAAGLPAAELDILQADNTEL